MTRPLANITREHLEPLWMRHDIPTARIAEALGVTRQAVSYKAKTLGLPPRTGNKRSMQKVDDETFRRMWLAGVNVSDMAKAFGYGSKSAITARRRLLGLPPRTRTRGTRKSGGWQETISAAQFHEMEVAQRMTDTKHPSTLEAEAKALRARVAELETALREIIRMSDEGADAPTTAYRWCDRIEDAARAALRQDGDQ